MVITAAQVRAARAILGWNQSKLAEKAVVAVNTIRRIEQEKGANLVPTIDKVQRTLERAGIEFFPGDGVRRKAPPGGGRP